MPPQNQNPEQLARDAIDAQLHASGWAIQAKDEINFHKGDGQAIREYHTDSGPADYVLFVDSKPVGVIEAKKETSSGTSTASSPTGTTPTPLTTYSPRAILGASLQTPLTSSAAEDPDLAPKSSRSRALSNIPLAPTAAFRRSTTRPRHHTAPPKLSAASQCALAPPRFASDLRRPRSRREQSESSHACKHRWPCRAHRCLSQIR